MKNPFRLLLAWALGWLFDPEPPKIPKSKVSAVQMPREKPPATDIDHKNQ